MIILNSLNGGRIYRGGNCEVECLVFPRGLIYEDHTGATVEFRTLESGPRITKNVSDYVITDRKVTFLFTSEDLDSLPDGVLSYVVDYGDVRKEFYTNWYLTSPINHQSTGGYATEEYVDEAIEEAISGISAVTVDEVEDMISSSLTPYYTSAQTDSAISTATSGLTKKTSFTAHTADTSVHFTMSDVETDISGYLRRNMYAQMGDVNDAVGAAVNQIEYELGSYVRSDTCHNIWSGSQAQYDAMSAHSADTLYIIL